MQRLIWAIVIPILLVIIVFRFVFFLGELIWSVAQALLNPANMILFILLCVAVYYTFFAPEPPQFRL